MAKRMFTVTEPEVEETKSEMEVEVEPTTNLTFAQKLQKRIEESKQTT